MVTFMQNFTGVLAIVAALGIIVILVGRLLNVGVLSRAANLLLDHRLLITAGIGVTATLGSLYFSEMGLKYAPCRWCWYQRTMMYPIAVIGIVAFARRDRLSRPYFLALSGIGMLMSIRHTLLEIFPPVGKDLCALVGPSCSEVYFRAFNFLSLANMALIGFAAVFVLNVFRGADTVEAGHMDTDNVGAGTTTD